MFKKLFAAFMLLSVASTSVLAANYTKTVVYKRKIVYETRKEPKRIYKGEVYKGELPPLVVKSPPPLDFVPCSTPTFVPGPYIGVSPGLINNYNRTSSVYKAFEGTIFAGYAMLNASFYLAAEIFAQDSISIQNYRNDLNVNGNPIGVKTTWGAGLSILPGFILADTLLGYLRVGALKTHFYDIAQTATGGQVGIGLQGTVSDDWDLRAEYTYTFYQSLTSLGSPRSDAFRLGFLYKFWG